MRLLVTFYSVSSALFLEAAGKERGLPCVIIPVPRSLSSSCGYAAEVDVEETGNLAELLRGLNVEWEAVYRPGENRYELLYRNE
ncbi:MAG: DUF3343 domain-containing protein [Spirochaetaceae bacterium]|nr:DUF3343 domain-containing protein [Spirochaetaceae bacterium]